MDSSISTHHLYDRYPIKTHIQSGQCRHYQQYLSTHRLKMAIFCRHPTGRTTIILYCASLLCTKIIIKERGVVSNSMRLNSHTITDTEKESHEFYLPRCIVIMSPEPYFKIHVNLLKIHRELRKSSPNIAHTTSPKALSGYLKLKNEGRQH